MKYQQDIGEWNEDLVNTKEINSWLNSIPEETAFPRIIPSLPTSASLNKFPRYVLNQLNIFVPVGNDINIVIPVKLEGWPVQEDKTVERILKVTKKSGNRERDVGCCLYESANR